MRESEIERYLGGQIKEKLGGLCLKFVPDYSRGMPDRLVVLPGGRMFFVELKQENGVLSPAQIICHRELSRFGVDVKVVWSRADVDHLIRGIKKEG